MKQRETPTPGLFSDLPWPLAIIAAVWIGLLFADPGLRPPHHDEGVNGWYVMQMWHQGFFRYNPANYHGPLFFYLLQFSELIFGKGIVSLRLVTMFFSVLNVLLVLAHRHFFGRIALWAALVMAFSPAALFYGRYAIHETVLISFQLLFSFGYFNYVRRLSWRTGVVCMVTGFFGTLLIKETFFIFFGTWFIAVFLIKFTARFFPEVRVDSEVQPPQSGRDADAETAFVPVDHRSFLFATIGINAVATLLIFSGFLMNPRGIIDMVLPLIPWMKTGVASGHEKPFLYWLDLMRTYEWASLAALGAAALMGWRTSSTGRLWCAVAIGSVLAYSLIPYKTPWCILNLIWPLSFVFGYAVEAVGRKWRVAGNVVAYFLASLLIAISAGQAARLNFLHPADPAERYVYTHSAETILQLSDQIRRTCNLHPEARNMRIVVATKQTWPLPWTLSDYPGLHFSKFRTNQSLFGDVLVVDIRNRAAVEKKLKQPFYRVHGKLRDAYTDILIYYKAARFEDSWMGGGELFNPPRVPKENTP